jgi:energy-coupling factor transporter transmembrane protein EcfT
VTTVQLAFWEKLHKNPPRVNLISFLLLSIFFATRTVAPLAVIAGVTSLLYHAAIFFKLMNGS